MKHVRRERSCKWPEETKRCGLNGVAFFACNAWFKGTRAAFALGACRWRTRAAITFETRLPALQWSFRSVTHDVKCGRENMSVHRSLLLAIEGDQEMRTTHIGSTN